ncbi:MAG TPA: PaaI family thioesterase [Desulfobacteria bacterium]|nr:PaaI family thioesterase [Desulfobacteria bacterium]
MRFIKQPFDEFLGFEYERNNNIIEVSLKIKDLYINSTGVVHGGVISSLADVAMSNLIPADKEGVQEIVTVDLKVSFLKPAEGKSLLAKAWAVKTGRKLVFAECKIYNDKEELVALSNGIYSRLSK